MDHHGFLMIQGLWLWAVAVSFGGVVFDASQNTEPVRGKRWRISLPSCQDAALVLSAEKDEKSAEQKTWAYGFGHGDLEWLCGSLCGAYLRLIQFV